MSLLSSLVELPFGVLFGLGSAAAILLVAALAGAIRGRFYALFCLVILTVHTLPLSVVVEDLPVPRWLILYLHATVFVHFFSLIWARMRPVWWRALISLPGMFFAASSIGLIPWVIVVALGLPPHGVLIPYALGLIGVWQSLNNRKERFGVDLSERTGVATLKRFKLKSLRWKTDANAALRIVQITDPHLGPFMSVKRLAEICQDAVDAEPDLILLTGDFLTMESRENPSTLRDALAPLRALEGKTFACFGNHDHEAPELVREVLADSGIQLLVDEAVSVETRVGEVQIVGLDFNWRDREAKMQAVFDANPRGEDTPRLVMLHDPGAFKYIADGEGDLVLSGHTHGGHVGLQSLGIPWTVVSAATSMPDYGFWAKGTNRLYVHRGTGHYGFPLRLGVSGEESVMQVKF